MRKKSVVVTFRVDSHLAEALDRLQDKSAFIRDALRRSFHDTCPACGGEGRVDCEAAEWMRDLLEREGARRCECCGSAFAPGSDDREVCRHCGADGHEH